MKPQMIRRKLLVVDDDEQTRILIREILDDTAIPVIEIDCGTGVFELYKQQQQEIGLILLDIWLPGCDGWSLIRRIRELDSEVPAIAISAMFPNDLVTKYQAAGFTDYLVKPFDINHLRSIILSYLQPSVNNFVE